MKKLSIVGMSALLMLAVSCQKEKGQKLELQGNGFYATAEMQQSDSKTHLNGSAVNWDANDQVLVFNQVYPGGYVFTASQIDPQDPKKTLLTNDQVPDEFYTPDYNALYPYAKVTAADGGFQMTLPATQSAVFSNGKFVPQFENGANPMGVCNATDEDLYFQNLCGILDLQLYSTTAYGITKIELTNNGEGNVNGKALVNLDGQNPLLGNPDGNKTITLNCNGKALSTNANEPSHFYFVLPAGTLDQGFTVTVTKTNGKTWTKTATAGNNTTIERSVITVMDKLDITEPIVVPEGAIPGLFSVSSTKKVFFSQGYLTYHENDNKWYFWDNQTDFDHNGYTPANKIVSLFTWGYGNWSKTWNTNEHANVTVNLNDYSASSDFVDWGVNPIENGGKVGGQWRTLTTNEILYLLFTRVGKNNYDYEAYGKSAINVYVDGVLGLLIYPDDYNGTYYDHMQTITGGVPNGCAFLACAGYRVKYTDTFSYVAGYTSVMSSTCGADYDWNASQWVFHSKGLSFPSNYESGIGRFNPENVQDLTWGFPVRLVQDYVEPSNN